mgnify:CR=1 FL=1
MTYFIELDRPGDREPPAPSAVEGGLRELFSRAFQEKYAAEFDESKVKRADDGKFADKEGGVQPDKSSESVGKGIDAGSENARMPVETKPTGEKKVKTTLVGSFPSGQPTVNRAAFGEAFNIQGQALIDASRIIEDKLNSIFQKEQRGKTANRQLDSDDFNWLTRIAGTREKAREIASQFDLTVSEDE